MTGFQPKRIYLLDEDVEITGSEPIGSMNEKVNFVTEHILRLYPTVQEDKEAPYIEFYVTKDSIPTAVFHFCEYASPTQLKKFWNHVHCKSVVDNMSDRWGSIIIEWGGPGSRISPMNNTLTIYFDDDIGFSFLHLSNADNRTYNELLSDYIYLKELYDASLS